MAEADPAQLLRSDDTRERRANERKHAPETSVEQQRLVAEDEELVEGESGGRGDLRHEGREPVDTGCDFGSARFHEFGIPVAD